MESYNQVDVQLHIMCQVIAKANRAYVPHKDDHSHTNLYYNHQENRIEGRPIKSESGSFMLTFNLVSQIYSWVNDENHVIQSISPFGKSIAEVYEAVQVGLFELSLDPNIYIEPMSYSMPNYPLLEEGKILPQINSEDVMLWGYHRNIANRACAAVLEGLKAAGEIRLWPHHFDTGIYVQKEGMGIGFGLAIKDEIGSAPYYYVSGYPTEGKLDYQNVPELSKGRWITGSWDGAILPIPDLSKKEVLALEDIDQFVDESSKFFLSNSIA